MSESADERSEVVAESTGGFVELRSNAERLAGGLDLLRWAMITMLASWLLVVVGRALMVEILSPGSGGWAWSIFALEVTGWVIAPLALMGVVRILRVRRWSVQRWLVIVLIAYFAAECISTPLWSVYWLVSVTEVGGMVQEYIGVASTMSIVLLSLVYFAVLFAGCDLARAADAYFDRSLISEHHRRWLLWVGVMLHSVALAWWLVGRIWDPAALIAGGDEIMYEMLAAVLRMLFVALPHFAWFIWLLVVAFRIGKKLKRFVKLDRCPRCDYDVRGQLPGPGVALGRGCPECGWMRAERSASST